jgi:hypothetical protein
MLRHPRNSAVGGTKIGPRLPPFSVLTPSAAAAYTPRPPGVQAGGDDVGNVDRASRTDVPPSRKNAIRDPGSLERRAFKTRSPAGATGASALFVMLGVQAVETKPAEPNGAESANCEKSPSSRPNTIATVASWLS